MEKSFRDIENKEGPRRVSKKGSIMTFTCLIFVENRVNKILSTSLLLTEITGEKSTSKLEFFRNTRKTIKSKRAMQKNKK